jgi:hypothetical protein
MRSYRLLVEGNYTLPKADFITRCKVALKLVVFNSIPFDSKFDLPEAIIEEICASEEILQDPEEE